MLVGKIISFIKAGVLLGRFFVSKTSPHEREQLKLRLRELKGEEKARIVGKILDAEELERRRGIPVGTVKISMLLETAKGIMNAYECCMASSRNVNAIFGAVDYCRDMRVKLTSEAVEQMGGLS